jgi:DNA-binding SARP family transcriptional activator
LALLAAAPGRQASRDRLRAMLWPEREAEQGRTLLNTAVHALRRELGAEALRTIGDSLYLDPEQVETDLDRFEQSVLDGTPFRAVAEYLGPFLDGFHLPGSESFEEWLTTKRHHYHHRTNELLEELADGASSPAAAVEWTERLVHHDRHSARAAVRHMQALRDAGDGPAALAFATNFQQRLALDLDAGPDPDVRDLELELMQREAEPRPVRRVISTPPPIGTSAVPSPVKSRGSRRVGALAGSLALNAIASTMPQSARYAATSESNQDPCLGMHVDITSGADQDDLGH